MMHEERAKALVSRMSLEEKMGQMRYNAPAIERLGVPEYNWWNECLHGVARSGAATVFPQAIAMAASFDAQLLGRIASAISDEARAKYNEYRQFGGTQIYQGLTMWSPNINIFRDPRWGRGHETYGEDPRLTGEMGCAFIKGLQGEDPIHRKVDATIKHYAVHSGPEKDRHGFDAVVGEDDLCETYLWAFKYCIQKADPSAVMGAYNRINGEVACGSETYLRKVLRGEFGFKGYVVSDCGAISDFHEHHKITKDEPESAALAVNSGCDLNCGKSYEWLREAAARGLVSEATITLAVERLFAARYRLGMLGDATVYDRIGYEVVECEAHRELGRAMAREGMVLLKNDGILPLAKGASIAVIGPNADDRSVLLGNYNGTPSRHSTLLRGLQEAAAAGGGSVRYARGCEIGGEEVAPWSEHPEREAVLAARGADLVVMCMGLNPSMEGEEGDAYNGFQCGDKRDLELPVLQQRLYEAVLATGKPIVFVNVSGSCVNLTRQAQTASAILQCFYPGAEGGAALADLLYGAFSPSGKLPVTFYRSVADLPPFEDYSMKGRTYRYFEKEPLYEFGFGLSYSSFSIESPRLEGNVASVHLTNTGGIDAAEVVQLYETWPGTPVSAKTPRRRLIAFRRIFLKAGEEATVSFPASPTEGAVLVANPFKQRE